MNDQTQPTTTARRGRPPNKQADSSKTTASSGNAPHRTQKQTLARRLGAMERQIGQQGELLKSIARAVS